jgi:hypothetical protein
VCGWYATGVVALDLMGALLRHEVLGVAHVASSRAPSSTSASAATGSPDAVAAAVRDATGLPIMRVPVRPDDIALAPRMTPRVRRS